MRERVRHPAGRGRARGGSAWSSSIGADQRRVVLDRPLVGEPQQRAPVVAQRVRHLALRGLRPELHGAHPVRRVLRHVLLHERLLAAMDADHRERPVARAPGGCGRERRRGSRPGRASSPRRRRTAAGRGWSATPLRATLRHSPPRRRATVASWQPRSRPQSRSPFGERVVRISNPDRVYFPQRGDTKLDLANYYLSVGDGHRQRAARAAVHAAPLPDRRQRREGAPEAGAAARRRGSRPCASHFPRYGQHADELCVTELADVIWAVQMSTVEFHPWNSRRADTEKPDEWRIDLDPMPDCPFEHGATGGPRRARGARRARRRRLAEDVGRQGHARLCPDRAVVRIHRRASCRAGVRPRGRAACAGRRHDDVVAQGPRSGASCSSTTTRMPATTRWRRAYSVRGVPEATVSTPITWDEIDDVEPGDFTMATVPRALRRTRRPARRHRRRGVRHRRAARVGGPRRARGRRGRR